MELQEPVAVKTPETQHTEAHISDLTNKLWGLSAKHGMLETEFKNLEKEKTKSSEKDRR